MVRKFQIGCDLGMLPMHDSRPLEDPSEIRRGQSRRLNRSLRWILISMAVLMAGIALVDYQSAPPGKSRFFISLSMCGVALLSYLLVRAHRSQWVSPLLVVSALAVTGWAMYTYGSVRAASGLALMGVVVLAGTYLRLRSLVATTAASLLILGALTWAEAGGHLVKPGLEPDFMFWVMGSVVVVLTGSLLLHSRRATDEAHLRRLNQLEDRLRMEHEREQSLRRFNRIFRLNPTALVIQLAGTQAIQEVNPAFERSFGYRSDQLAGQQAGVLWADERQWQEHLKVLFEKGRTDWQRARWVRSDGQAVDVMTCSELSEDNSGMLILTTVTDWSGDAGGRV
jgi:PAS domain S-box-containing protein